MANDALKIVTHEDVELAKRPLGRAGVMNPADAVDPAKLMEMLGDIDSLKREIQDRMRRIEAVKQAKSLLIEDAQRTEALNKRLAEIGKVMSAVHSGLLVQEKNEEDEGLHRLEGREPAPVLVVHEGVALPWPKPEEAAKNAAFAPELTLIEAQQVPSEELVAEPSATEDPAVHAMAESAAEFASLLAIAEILEMPAAAGQVLEEAVPEPVVEANAEVVEEQPAVACTEPTEAELEVQETVAIHEPEVLVHAEQAQTISVESLNRAEELVREARRLLEESSARLDIAVQREEQATADLLAGHETMTAEFQKAGDRLSEAERCWKLADEAAAQAKRLFDDSTAQLTLAVSKEQQSSADFHAAQKALTAAYQSASQRLEAAEQYAKDGDSFAAEARKLLQRMETELAEARTGAASATEDLQSARQELTTAYQFASVAAQRRLDSAEFYRKTASWVVFSTAFAWMLAIWMAWVAFHRTLPIAIPFAASCLILAAAVFLRRRGARDLEEA
jgi:hypothetical protein